MYLVEDHPSHFSHYFTPSIEHGTEDFRRHDETRGAWINGNVARHQADIAEFLLRVEEDDVIIRMTRVMSDIMEQKLFTPSRPRRLCRRAKRCGWKLSRHAFGLAFRQTQRSKYMFDKALTCKSLNFWLERALIGLV